MKKTLLLTLFSSFLFAQAWAKPFAELQQVKSEMISKSGRTHFETKIFINFKKHKLKNFTAPLLLNGRERLGLLEHNRGEFKIRVNYKRLQRVINGKVRLPNGGRVPFINDLDAVELEVGKTPLKTYFALKGLNIVVGLTFLVKQLDGLGAKMGHQNLFPKFKVKGLDVAAGGFLSKKASENGLGAFARFKIPLKSPYRYSPARKLQFFQRELE